MSENINREVRLKRRPVGLPQPGDFEIVSGPVPEAGPDEVLVRNIYMSVDPYMRGRMRDWKSYAPSFQLGQTMPGRAVGQVIQSRRSDLPAGSFVSSMNGWREYFTSDGRGLSRIEAGPAPLSAYLGVLGMPGMTAYVGLLDIGRPQAGQTVFVSGAAGAVGSVVCQIARLKGCRVVGSAGSPEKVAWLLDEVGIDAALNYKTVADLTTALGQHCPKGIDIYFDNVGGTHLEAALSLMNQHGRIVACGMIANYNFVEPQPGPSNLFTIVGKRLLIQGFIVSDHMDREAQFQADMSQWIAEGKISWQETIFAGIEQAPAAFIGLFNGQNLGKMVVKLGPDPAI
jgi:hypothetical protein